LNADEFKPELPLIGPPHHCQLHVYQEIVIRQIKAQLQFSTWWYASVTFYFTTFSGQVDQSSFSHHQLACRERASEVNPYARDLPQIHRSLPVETSGPQFVAYERLRSITQPNPAM